MPYKDKNKALEHNREYRRSNKERVNQLNRERYYKHHDEVLARKRELYRENIEHVREYRRKEREENPERIRNYQRKYQQKHPDNLRAKSHRYRARKANCSGRGITPGQEKQIFEDYGYRCVYCGNTKKITLDHIIPLSRGGPHDITNVVPACQSCNSSKIDKPLFVWMLDKMNV